MSRRFYVIRNGKWMEVFRGEPSEQVAPFIITDSMTPTFHPATDKLCDSKSEFKRITKAAGYEDRTGASRVADNIPKFKESSTEHYEAEVKKAYEMVRSGTAPLSDYDKHVCKQINERIKNRV